MEYQSGFGYFARDKRHVHPRIQWNKGGIYSTISCKKDGTLPILSMQGEQSNEIEAEEGA